MNKKTVLITPKALVILMCFISLYALVFYKLFQWTPEAVGMYVAYAICVVCFVYKVQFFPKVQEQLTVMGEDVKIIQSHWENDHDLRKLTYLIRTLYALSIVFWVAGFYFLATVPLEEMAQAMSGFMPQVENWFWNSHFAIAWMVGSILFVLSATVELLANIHIILSRNNPVRGMFSSLCKVCYEWTGKVVVGTSAGTAAAMQFLSVMPGAEVTAPLQLLQKYGPLNAGYSFELGTRLPSLRNAFLLHVPGYNPWEFVDPQTRILDTQLQEQWIQDNIGQVRAHCSTSTLQLIQIDPKPFSRY